jgi:hypothetical protein
MLKDDGHMNDDGHINDSGRQIMIIDRIGILSCHIFYDNLIARPPQGLQEKFCKAEQDSFGAHGTGEDTFSVGPFKQELSNLGPERR